MVWYILVHPRILRYNLIHFSILWCTPLHSGTLWYNLVHSGTLWYTLEYYGNFGGSGSFGPQSFDPHIHLIRTFYVCMVYRMYSFGPKNPTNHVPYGTPCTLMVHIIRQLYTLYELCTPCTPTVCVCTHILHPVHPPYTYLKPCTYTV